MDRHRTAVELDKPRARALRDLAEDHDTNVSVIVRAMIAHYLELPGGDEARQRVDQALADAAAAESARRGAVAASALHDRDGGSTEQSSTERRRVSVVLEKGQAPAMKTASGTSAAVAIRTLVGRYLDLEDGPERAALTAALDEASAAESARRAGIGRQVMTERHAERKAREPKTGDERRDDT
ncbi:MAG: hypothetical protein ACI38U_02185 [Corynebacterium sp.]|uniref:hypothetical protein n=1 Tax=Corynebacterium sp. TaxID=1720 RepID=UPI003EFC7D48